MLSGEAPGQDIRLFRHPDGDPFASARYANVAAALSTEGYGAVGPMPRRAAVEAALAE